MKNAIKHVLITSAVATLTCEIALAAPAIDQAMHQIASQTKTAVLEAPIPSTAVSDNFMQAMFRNQLVIPAMPGPGMNAA